MGYVRVDNGLAVGGCVKRGEAVVSEDSSLSSSIVCSVRVATRVTSHTHIQSELFRDKVLCCCR